MYEVSNNIRPIYTSFDVDHKEPTLARRETSKSLLRTSKLFDVQAFRMFLTSLLQECIRTSMKTTRIHQLSVSLSFGGEDFLRVTHVAIISNFKRSSLKPREEEKRWCLMRFRLYERRKA